MKLKLTLYFFLGLTLIGCAQNNPSKTDHKFEVVKSKEEWKAQLTELEYDVLRNEGTERPFTGPNSSHRASWSPVFTCKSPM